jgi:hypothetical protein
MTQLPEASYEGNLFHPRDDLQNVSKQHGLSFYTAVQSAHFSLAFSAKLP